jgi:hypothetical protein
MQGKDVRLHLSKSVLKVFALRAKNGVEAEFNRLFLPNGNRP